MSTTKHPGINKGSHRVTDELMELVVERSNMQQAFRRVVGNKGAAGVDGMTVDQLRTHLKTNWEVIKMALLNDSFQPQGVRVVMIPKPSGGERQLGIPTVVARLIQQALHQVLGLIYDLTFSDNSYGFRVATMEEELDAQGRFTGTRTERRTRSAKCL